MAQPYVTGAVHLFVGPMTEKSASTNAAKAPGGQLRYLGTAEAYPTFAIRPGFLPLFNDITGPVIPYDMAYTGEEAFTAANLTRWNESTYQFLANRSGKEFDEAGKDGYSDMGTLMIHEASAVALYLIFPYAIISAYQGMPAGYKFHASWLVGPDDHNRQGTTPKRLHLLFHSLRVPTQKELKLYDILTPSDPAFNAKRE